MSEPMGGKGPHDNDLRSDSPQRQRENGGPRSTTGPSPKTVLVAAKLHKNQLERHLELLERLDDVARILVVRHEPLPQRLSKLENLSFKSGSVPMSAIRMVGALDRALRREKVDWVVGFNPVPWGGLAQAVAERHGVRTCLSLIGRDYLQLNQVWAAPFRRAVRRSTQVTATGQSMLEGLVGLGVPRERVHVLPHSVDLERFRPRAAPQEFDVVSVGQLIRRKRMDVLITAISLLARRGLQVRLGILGKGPEEGALRAQIRNAGLEAHVKLLPYRDDVEALLVRAKVFALVSAWEGVPFALMEAMACGLVPVVTDVGTIADWVLPGENGRIVPVGDPAAVADALEALLAPASGEWERLHRQLLAERERLSFTSGVDVWRRILA